MVLANVDAEVAALLGLVRAVGALVRGRLAAALHVLVPAQGRLPAVLLTAVSALELAAGILRAAVEPALSVAVEGIAGVPAAGRERPGIVHVVGVVGQHDVVGVVVLGLRVGLLPLAERRRLVLARRQQSGDARRRHAVVVEGVVQHMQRRTRTFHPRARPRPRHAARLCHQRRLRLHREQRKERRRQPALVGLCNATR